MLKISVFIILIFLSSLYSADNTLLNDQLEAINRQLGTAPKDAKTIEAEMESPYDYNQNAVYQYPNYAQERIYIGVNAFFGHFSTNSDDSRYTVRESTTYSNLKLGYIFKTNTRLEVVWLEEADLSYTAFMDKASGFDLNLILPYSMNSAGNIHLKVQGGVGVYDYSDFSIKGFSANGAVGVIGDITNDIELDITYIFKYIYWRDLGDITSSTEISSTNFTGMLFGLKYKF